MSFFKKIKISSKTEEKNQPKTKKISEELKKEWSEQEEGQLAIDVYETDTLLVLQSTIAGVKAGDLDLSIENDMVTIRGKREKPTDDEKKNYFYQECYWGPFSRQVILPEEVDVSQAEAIIKEGVLTVKIPKLQLKKKRKIEITEED